jgi:menaquinone-dependent protoporphyrinogen oxidase
MARAWVTVPSRTSGYSRTSDRISTDRRGTGIFTALDSVEARMPPVTGGGWLQVTEPEVTMSQPIMVVYATKRESTHEVAETIAARLRELGHEVDVWRAGDIGMLRPYGAVVLGGGLYGGRWHRDARRFLATHRDELSKRPVAVFAMGPVKLEPAEIRASRQQLDRALAKEPWLEPVSVAVFGGVIDPAKMRFPLNHLEAADARDWDAIRSWADELAEAFAPTFAV